MATCGMKGMSAYAIMHETMVCLVLQAPDPLSIMAQFDDGGVG